MSFGIICEYNPFHNGHLHQINEIKRMSDEPIVCVMSGNFTQRGENAIADKYERAKMAISAGASLVIELPVPFCIASAEYFASAGVYILNKLCVDKLCFGSECADASLLERIATVACGDDFKRECESMPKNEGNAASYFELLANKAGVDGLLSNDILGIEYTKAIIKNGYDMKIFPIKREGNAYRDNKLALGELPSASAIRGVIENGNIDDLSEFIPAPTLQILKECELSDINYAKDGILLALRLMGTVKNDLAISDRGLVNRILALSQECISFDEFEEKMQTKKYTRSAIRRAILYILLGIEQGDLEAMPEYALLLGATVKGREYLASIRKKENAIKVITKPSEAENCRQFELSKKADALYTMCFANKKVSGFYIKKSPIIL